MKTNEKENHKEFWKTKKTIQTNTERLPPAG
jgi:hypothetical protein